MDGWLGGRRLGGWVDEWVGERMSEWVDGWMVLSCLVDGSDLILLKTSWGEGLKQETLISLHTLIHPPLHPPIC